MMTVNFRGRVENLSEELAGNYQDVIRYRAPDYASPALIRQSVDALRRASQPPTALLTWLGHLGCRSHAVVTNWASFDRGVEIDGCSQDLTLTLTRLSRNPEP
jgi:hypothetical protein